MLYSLEETNDQVKYICECGKENFIAKNKVKLNSSEDMYLLKFIIKCDNCKAVHEKILLRKNENINFDELRQGIVASEEEKIKRIQEHRKKIENHILTTGCCLEGYKIIEYKGLVSGESVLGTGVLSSITSDIADFTGGESHSYMQKLDKAKKLATNRMTEASVKMGGNAIIGIDIDINIFSRDIIGISTNGTSVVVEKI